MANVTLVDEPRGLVQRMAFMYSRMRFKRVVDPVKVAAHHKGVVFAAGVMETAVDKGLKKLDRHLMWLAVQASSGAIGCSWCTDFGYYEGMQKGVDPRKVRDVPRWRESDAYDERERAVLEYAQSATATPAVVSDELVRRLHEHLTEPEIVELAAWVAIENYRSRFNAGLGLRSEGFSDDCRVPEDPTAVTGRTAATRDRSEMRAG